MTTTVTDAYRMAYAGYMDGHGDDWHGPFAAGHGVLSKEIYAALRVGRAQARVDDATYCELACQPAKK
jgi:hypothetical protein